MGVDRPCFKTLSPNIISVLLALEATDNKDKDKQTIDSLLENIEQEGFGNGDSLLVTRDEVELELKDAEFVAKNNEFMGNWFIQFSYIGIS